MDSYNKIIRLSNTLYNAGLEKAKVRDLSGAAACLRKSLRFYKANTQARNLLGLVYFELGETVDALSEWVISRSLQPEDNIAEQYLEEIQSNRAQLNSVNQTIKKYNQALMYCQQGSRDLAIIQLKKVLSLNPRLTKGHQLLALLYMEDGKYEQSKKELRLAGRIDTNSTITLRYLKEVNQKLHGEPTPSKNSRKEKEDLVSYQSGNETIIQPANFKDNSGIMTILNIIIGLVIGVAITCFLVIPSLRQNVTSQSKKSEIEANNTISTKNQEIKKLESKVEELNGTISNMQSEADNAQSVKDNYDQFIAAYDAFAAEDMEKAGTAMAAVKPELLGESSKTIYDALNGQINQQYIKTAYDQGMASYNGRKYEEAAVEFEKVVQIEEDYEDGNALYYLAQSYRKLENIENATKYYQRVVELHPGTERARTSQNYLDEEANP